MDIYWDDRSGENLPDDVQTPLTEVIRLGLDYTRTPDTAEISVSFVTPEEIRSLNRDYRQKDSETDVLSFPFFEEIPPSVPDGQPLALGDIVICPKVAASQSETYGHSYLRELAFLTVHGLLHLLGYDHETTEDEEAMTRVQEEILQKAGIGRE